MIWRFISTHLNFQILEEFLSLMVSLPSMPIVGLLNVWCETGVYYIFMEASREGMVEIGDRTNSF